MVADPLSAIDSSLDRKHDYLRKAPRRHLLHQCWPWTEVFVMVVEVVVEGVVVVVAAVVRTSQRRLERMSAAAWC